MADVDHPHGHLLLAVWVLFGSAIPFVPTGEMVAEPPPSPPTPS